MKKNRFSKLQQYFQDVCLHVSVKTKGKFSDILQRIQTEKRLVHRRILLSLQQRIYKQIWNVVNIEVKIRLCKC